MNTEKLALHLRETNSDIQMYEEIFQKKENQKQDIAIQLGLAISQVETYKNQLQKVCNDVEKYKRTISRGKKYFSLYSADFFGSKGLE
jgi:archaellum component FlaC